MDRFAVVILNWNGAPDTIACIRSIRRSDPDAVAIVIDNASSDDSFSRIQNEIEKASTNLIVGTEHEVLDAVAIRGADAVLVRSKENLGFAGGCNLGLRLAESASFDVTVFLNNDTELEHEALTKLVRRIRAEPMWFAVLPLTMIHGSNRIANCGGRVSRLGVRRYNFAGSERSSVSLPHDIPCSFFTGCCFAVRTQDFVARKGFSERFFFGEEDFELSLWMKDRGYRALCITESIIHHKVGASISRASGTVQASKMFVYYLNRFIHMRLRLGYARWSLWLALYVPYIAGLLAWRRIVPVSNLPGFFRACIARAAHSDGVARADFESIMKARPW